MSKKNSIPPDKDGYYRSRFTYKGKQYVVTGKTPEEATKKAALKLDKLERGEVGISGKMTVKQWSAEWLETYKKPVVAEKQYQMYEGMINNVINPEIGSLRLVDVTDVHLQKILNKAAGKSSSYAHKLKNTLCSMFKMARASRLINYNPSEFLSMPKTTNGSRRSLTTVERAAFLKVAETHTAGMMFKVMLFCGLRTGEVVALDWRDIDFDKRRIKISRAIESGTGQIKEPKTAAGMRDVPIPDEIYDDLLNCKGEPFSPVFLQEKGKVRHTATSRAKAWNSLKREMDIVLGARFKKIKAKDGKMRTKKVLSVVAPDLVPYCLRHTYCTDLQDKGIPINVAKYLMGHNSINVTAGIYTHITDVAINDAADKISGRVKELVKNDKTAEN